jgi:hypothetical protein
MALTGPHLLFSATNYPDCKRFDKFFCTKSVIIFYATDPSSPNQKFEILPAKRFAIFDTTVVEVATAMIPILTIL